MSSVKGGSRQRSSCLLCGSPADWVSELVLPGVSLPWSHRWGRRHEAGKRLVVLVGEVRPLGCETQGGGEPWWGLCSHCTSCGVAALAASSCPCSGQRCPNRSCLSAFMRALATQFLWSNCIWQAFRTRLCCRQKKVQALSCPCSWCPFLTSCSKWKPFNPGDFGVGNSDYAYFTLNFRWPFLGLKCIKLFRTDANESWHWNEVSYCSVVPGKELEIICSACSCFLNSPKTNPLLRRLLRIAACTSGSWRWHTVLVTGFLVMRKNSWGNVNWNTSKLS